MIVRNTLKREERICLKENEWKGGGAILRGDDQNELRELV